MDKKRLYPAIFLAPAMVIFLLFFIIPMVVSFFFSMTVWDFNGFTFCGLDNFILFFSERSLSSSLLHTIIYALGTSGLKVIIAFFIAVFLTGKIRSKNVIRSMVFFPNLVSTVAIGVTFTALMHPTKGLFNIVLAFFGIQGPDWLGNPNLALYSVIATDVWKGISVATIIYIAGISSIDKSFYEAASIDGANGWQKLKYITIPLCRPAMNSVIILSFIGVLRSFDLIWSMTSGGPGFASDVLASVVYKQYAAGFYGVSTAGNVIMFVVIALLAFPLQKYLMSKEME